MHADDITQGARLVRASLARPGRRATLLPLVLLGGALLLFGCRRHEEAPRLRSAVLVTDVAASGASAYVGRGATAPRARLRLGFRGAGLVKSVLVRPGDRVKKGALLATLDAGEAQIRAREASASFDRASKELARTVALVDSGTLPATALESSRAAANAAKTALDLARESTQGARLLAPISGTVFARHAEAGETVAAGAPIVVLDDVSLLVVRLGIPLREIERARNASRITLSGADGSALGEAILASIADVPETTTGLLDVELTPRTPLPRPGEIVAATFEAPVSAPVLRVPADAVVQGRGGATVFIVDDAHGVTATHRRPVQLDGIDSDGVVVRSGLRAGEHIVREGAAFLRDGDIVEVVD